jgi:hypothetical protein
VLAVSPKPNVDELTEPAYRVKSIVPAGLGDGDAVGEVDGVGDVAGVGVGETVGVGEGVGDVEGFLGKVSS